MSEHRSICEMLKKAEHDASLREALQAATSPQAVVQAASDAGCAVSMEEVEAFQADVQAVQQRAAEGELSDAELAGAAGGFDPLTIGLALGVTGVVVGGGALAATTGVTGGLIGWSIGSR